MNKKVAVDILDGLTWNGRSGSRQETGQWRTPTTEVSELSNLREDEFGSFELIWADPSKVRASPEMHIKAKIGKEARRKV